MKVLKDLRSPAVFTMVFFKLIFVIPSYGTLVSWSIP